MERQFFTKALPLLRKCPAQFMQTEPGQPGLKPILVPRMQNGDQNPECCTPSPRDGLEARHQASG